MGIQSGRSGFRGLPMKSLSLITLTFQNSALILLMHYSRIMPAPDNRRYFTSTAVFLNEVIKLAISLTMSLYELSNNVAPSTPATTLLSTLVSSIFTGDSWKLAIPAVLYTLQNTLQYVAVSNLDAATFQVTYQLKILSTALFSVMLLNRSLSPKRWLSLFLLMVGVAVVQLPTQADMSHTSDLKNTPNKIFFPRSIEDLRELGNFVAAQFLRRSATYQGIKEDVASQHPQLNHTVGLTAVMAACVLSGLAGVYFEKVLKDSNSSTSLWIRNVQLSFYSLFPAFFIGVVFKDGEEISRHGFFIGYNWVVWACIIFQAVGGVIVALVVNYADNIAKNFATSISILISFVASVYCFGTPITLTFIVGTCIVLYATYLYSVSPERRRPSPPSRIASYEETTVGRDSASDTESNGLLRVQPLSFKPSEALSTSRPQTPTLERGPSKGFTDRKVSSKRDE